MGLDTPETRRGLRNILRKSCASSWFLFTLMDFHKFLNIACHGNPSSGSCSDIHADRRTDGQMDVTKLIGAFCEYANAPERKNIKFEISVLSLQAPMPLSAIVLVDRF